MSRPSHDALRMHPADLQMLATLVAESITQRPRVVDRPSLSRIVGLSESTIERRTRAGAFPVLRSGRRVLYEVEVILAALRAESEVSHGA